jgi:4-methylaminobutanoate oxidase (formaldehyde-forming)
LGEKIIGQTTSGNYSFNFNKNIAFGYIDSLTNLDNKNFEIEVEKTMYKAVIEPRPLHDAENKIIKE